MPTQKIIDYKIFCPTYSSMVEFENLVKEEIKSGWVPLGAPILQPLSYNSSLKNPRLTVNSAKAFQAMVMYADD